MKLLLRMDEEDQSIIRCLKRNVGNSVSFMILLIFYRIAGGYNGSEKFSKDKRLVFHHWSSLAVSTSHSGKKILLASKI